MSSAWAHVGHSHFATFDIEDCFGSITPQMVQQALHRSGVDRRLVPLITGLCTFRGSLPQGAPTSMAILNAALLPLDTRIAAAAEQHGVAYTRFADDLVVSANRNIRFFGRIVEHELSNLRLRPARQKTRYWPAGKWPVINGVVVGDRPRIPAAYLRWTAKLIAELADATSSPDSTELLRLRGRVAWIESVEPKAGRRLAAELATSPAFRHSGVQIPA